MTRIILGPAEITEITEIFFAGEKLGASHNHFLYFCGTNNTIFLLFFLGPAEITEITEMLINGD